MYAINLGSILGPAEGLLLPFGAPPEGAALDLIVRGIELHQPATTADYTGQLVLVTVPVRTQNDLNQVTSQCQNAVALILHPDTSTELEHDQSSVLLRRSPWVTTEALLRALFALTQPALHPGDSLSTPAAGVLERDAALTIHRRESALLALLHGTSDAAVPASFLGLRPDRDHVVIAAGVSPEDFMALQLAITAEFSGENMVLSEGVLFVVLLVGASETPQAIVRRLRSRIGRAISSSGDLPIGVGSVVPGVYRLHESAASAREILRALRFKLGEPPLAEHGKLRVAEEREVSDALALIRAGDILRSQGLSLAEPLSILANYDREHQSELLRTVLSALEHRNNVAEAARRLGIHANSLRARIERVREVSGIDLADPVSALRVMVAFLASPTMHNAARETP